MLRALKRVVLRNLQTMDYIIGSETLRDLIKAGRKALKGDSNDAEHDALYEIVTTLEVLVSEGKGKSKRPDAKRP